MALPKLIEEIRSSNLKPKELLEHLSKRVLQDKSFLQDFAVCMEVGTTAEKGTCMEVLEYASKEKPAEAKAHLETVIRFLGDQAPRVKWEAARVIGNVAKDFPSEAFKAVDGLLANANDKGTVVRWSTAFALGEIFKHNPKAKNSLKEKIEAVLKKETNNGVKKVYEKALAEVEK